MFRKVRPDKRQLDLSFETAKEIRGGTDVFIKNADSKVVAGEKIRTDIIELLRPKLNKSGDTKLAFVMYLLEAMLGSDTIMLTQAHMIMMKKLKIGLRYRNDGASNISLDTCSIPVKFPDGVDGSLTLDKTHPEMFSFDKNCRRGEDSKSSGF